MILVSNKCSTRNISMKHYVHGTFFLLPQFVKRVTLHNELLKKRLENAQKGIL